MPGIPARATESEFRRASRWSAGTQSGMASTDTAWLTVAAAAAAPASRTSARTVPSTTRQA